MPLKYLEISKILQQSDKIYHLIYFLNQILGMPRRTRKCSVLPPQCQ